MNNPVRKHPVITSITVLIIGLLIWGFWPQPVFVEAIEAKRAPLTITIEEEGRTRVVDRYIISAPIDGVACRQQLNVGDEVTQGQVHPAGITGTRSAQPGANKSAGSRGRVCRACRRTAGRSSRSQRQTRRYRT